MSARGRALVVKARHQGGGAVRYSLVSPVCPPSYDGEL